MSFRATLRLHAAIADSGVDKSVFSGKSFTNLLIARFSTTACGVCSLDSGGFCPKATAIGTAAMASKSKTRPIVNCTTGAGFLSILILLAIETADFAPVATSGTATDRSERKSNVSTSAVA